MQPLARLTPLHLEHLIKVAIEDFALPADIDRVPTHQPFYRGGIEGVIQQRHVIAEEIVVLQVGGKPRNGEIRDREELVEDDSKMLFNSRL